MHIPNPSKGTTSLGRNGAAREKPSRRIGRMKMIFTNIAQKFESWRRYRASVRELQQLTDRELNDLGIVRSDIETVARQAAYI